MISSFLPNKSQELFAQLIRYAFVGILSNSTGYLIYLLVTFLGATPKLTMTLLYAVGALMGYIGNRNLTFAHKGNAFDSGVRYFIAHCFGYSLNLAILVVFVDKYGYAHQWVQAIAIFVVAGFLFITLKLLVFRDVNAANGNRL